MKDLAWDDIKLVKSIADSKGLAGAAVTLGVYHSTVFRRPGDEPRPRRRSSEVATECLEDARRGAEP